MLDVLAAVLDCEMVTLSLRREDSGTRMGGITNNNQEVSFQILRTGTFAAILTTEREGYHPAAEDLRP